MEDHRRGADLASHYEELLARQEESGLSVVEFASRSGVSAATLYSWRRRLVRGGPRPRIVEVEVSGMAEPKTTSRAIRLVVGERFGIELGPDFDGGALERLLGVLARC